MLQVCDKGTGHAEVVAVTFDPSVVTFRDLLDVFFTIHDPTTPNRQGADVGPQYRSIILYTSEEQKKTAEEVSRVSKYNSIQIPETCQKSGKIGLILVFARPCCMLLLKQEATLVLPWLWVHRVMLRYSHGAKSWLRWMGLQQPPAS